MAVPALRAARRLLVVAGAAVAGLLCALAGAVGLLGYTDAGHRLLLARAVPLLNREVLAGQLSVGRLHGGLLSHVILEDVRLDDAKGRSAVRARRLELRLSLRALAERRLQVDEVRVEGAEVTAQPLDDGRLNLAGLLRPRPAAPERPGGDGSGLAVRLDRVHLDGEVRLVRLVAPPLDGVKLQLEVDGRVELPGGARGEPRVEIDSLKLSLREPAQATISTGGGLALGTSLSLHGLRAELEAEGEELARLLPDGALPTGTLHGRHRLELSASGPLDALRIAARLLPPRGEVTVQATVSTRTLGWSAEVVARGLDPGSSWTALPPASVDLTARAEGQGRRAGVTVSRLVVEAAGQRLEGSGRGDSDGSADLEARIDAPDLRRLGELRSALWPPPPKLSGALRGRVLGRRRGGVVTFDVQADGEALAVAGARLGRVALRGAGAEPGVVAIDVTAEQVTGPARLDELSLRVGGDRRRELSLRGSARAEGDRGMGLEARAVPIGGAEAPGGFEVILDALGGRLGDRSVRLEAPARLSLGPTVRVGGLRLAAGPLRLAADGSYQRRGGAIDGEVRMTGIDASELAVLAARLGGGPEAASARDGGPWPHTSVQLIAHAGGTVGSPRISIAVEGTAEPAPKLALPASEGRLRIDLADGRARGELHLAAGGPRADLSFALPLPLRGGAPLLVDGTLDVPALEALRDALPPALASLTGRGRLTLHAAGTPRRPSVEAVVSGDGLGIAGLRDGTVRARIAADGATLVASLDLAARTGQGTPLGVVTVRVGAPLPLDLVALPRDPAARLLHHAAIDATAAIDDLDLAGIPWDELGVEPPARAGRLGISARSRGTLDAPAVALTVDARELALRGLLRPVRGRVTLDWAGDRVRLGGSLGTPGRTMVSLRGDAQLSLAALRAGHPLDDVPFDATVDLPGLDLSLLSEVEGVARGRLAVTGTPSLPRGEVRLDVAGLREGQRDLGALLLEGRGGWVGRRTRATVRLLPRPAPQGERRDGGELRAELDAGAGAGEPLSARLRAVDLDVGFLAALLPSVRELSARLGAEVTVGGTRAAPTVDGVMRVVDARVALDTMPDPFEHVDLEARLHEGVAELRRLSLAQSGGTLLARARARLDLAAGARPVDLEGTAVADGLPVPIGDGMGRLEAVLRLTGERAGEVPRTVVSVERGGLRLPRLETGSRARAVGPLADVAFVDARALREERQRARSAASARGAAGPEGSGALLVEVHLPGPFYLAGPDVSGELRGDVSGELRGGQLRAAGKVEVPRGVVRIADRPWEVQQAAVHLDGGAALDPQLFVRLARAVEEATLFIELTGTASAPRLTVRAEPARYDEKTIFTMIATGSDAPVKTDLTSQGLGAQAMSLASAMLLKELKKELGGYLPVEVLRMDLDYKSVNVAPTARLEVGKYILENLYLSYVYQNAPPDPSRPRNSHEAHVEYHFLRDYSLMGTFGDAAVGALDFFWNHRF